MRRKTNSHSLVRSMIGLTMLLVAATFILSRPHARAAATPFTVNSLADTDDGMCDPALDGCTLREAVNAANSSSEPDTIDFRVTGTINLTGPLPDITEGVTINGPGANLLTVRRDSGGDYRIFNIFGDFNVTIDKLTISNGRASGTVPDDGGGGIRKEGVGTLTITNSAVNANFAGYGGGILNIGGSLTVTDSTLSGNSAGQGGGFVNSGGAASVTNSTISYNSGAGGGIFNVGTLTVTNSTLNNNHAVFANGGGILSAGAPFSMVNILNSTLSGNSADVGGGGCWCINALTITSSTITANHAGGGVGGGIRQTSGPFLLRSTIVAGNFKGAEPTATADDINGLADDSSSFNVIGMGGSGGLTDGVNNNQVGVVNPGLGPLQDNGGATQTIELCRDSVAIDKGDDGVLDPPLSLTTDQRGLMRFRRRIGSHVDVGAYEVRGLASLCP